ncbi:MAG: acyl-CoA thioesterase [Rhodoferax sp.]|nr:acyl-CoA thioesterase [Rhodoferax sp.]
MSDNSTRASFRFFHRLRVRWAEVDLQKIVFNPHYLMYVDTALADYWRALALPYEQSLHAMGGDLFVRKSTLEFHASAVYDDVLDVGLRCARIGNSSLQLVCGIFRGEELFVSAELVYVFADPVAKVSLPVPQVLRDLLTQFEQGQSPVRAVLGDWQSLREAVCSLRPTQPQDAGAQHCVLYNAMNEAIACGRLQKVADAQVEGLFVSPLLRGAGWSRVVRQHLIAAKA